MGLGWSLIIKTLRFIDCKGQMGPQGSSKDRRAGICSCCADRDPMESGCNPPRAVGQGPQILGRNIKMEISQSAYLLIGLVH